MSENANGFHYKEETTDYGLGVSRGRRPGQEAPKAPGADPGGRPQSAAPAPLAEGPMTVAAPVNAHAAMLHLYGGYPSKKRPNGPPVTHLKPGQIDFNPFDGKWLNDDAEVMQ